MRRPRSPRIAVAALAACAAIVVGSCSGDDDASPAAAASVGGGDATTEPATTGADPNGGASDGSDSSDDARPGTVEPPTTPEARPAETNEDVDDATTGSAPTPTAPEAVSETGVPGLDSDDEFCAAWSRFAGTWQVLAVGANFLDDPGRVAEWEVASAAVVLAAYDTMLDRFPDELASEREAVADGYFGVLRRRAVDAAAALADVGADADDVAELAVAWLGALAGRDPTTPDLDFVAPAGLGDLVAAGAAELGARRVEFGLDPSLAVEVATPLTDDFLETECPDRGTLAGTEIDP